jgi:hypothetical protein
MRKNIIGFILALVVFFIPNYVFARTWDVPPEDGWSTNLSPVWDHPSPYQRDIYVDFSQNPYPDPLPSPYNGIPGADYAGTADEALRIGDWVEYDGDVTWNESKQAIGIGSGGNGSAEIEINNLNNPNGYKMFYVEANVKYSNPLGLLGSDFSFDFLGNGPASEYILDWNMDDLESSGFLSIIAENDYIHLEFSPFFGDNIYIRTWGYITPNPESELIQFSFRDIPDNISVWIDDIHVATHCVPIPGAIWLLGSGLIGIVGIRRKFKITI